jgi:Zn-dependent oligopeptidase
MCTVCCRLLARCVSQVLPIVVNNNNFNKPAPGEPCLLSFDDARTLFHEFGHGLHGMLSDVTYRRLAGASNAFRYVDGIVVCDMSMCGAGS